MSNIGTEARALLLKNYQGILSTNSVEMEGYPFGSVVPYCLDRTGSPIVLISQIAQHTKNIMVDPKVSLITIEQGANDVQIGGRLTWIADVVSLQDEESDAAADRYYKYFPQSRGFHKVHDFDFYRLELVRARYIAGFGKIHWISSDKILLANVFSAEQEQEMIEHMNQDHVAAMKIYCATANVEIEDVEPQIVGIDQEGFHLRLGEKIIRFNFSQPASTQVEIRARLAAMAHAK